ncbi:hypothetical protein [Pseudoalteromonas luteoviolacea]|uniref:SRCR domain-containing protein n=1 Tax=Pseudoalteromonas luteoviolacea NCIMB 1942 TaxID=1365253 RepID=A0A162AMA2_9GAMM|nr:hypothetical protein [Pseudoalteromonas luteoviolacea]KZN52387.1 hypothetical protein N482_05905 [Pseudoalteromonas luteoviolacea NCIMB 1942]KZX00298.1 hypothetical protein JL49_12310 [Pseudoalteromonas luteoviolacea]
MNKVILAAAFLISGSVSAAPLYCSGKVAGVYIQSNGDVNINGAWRNTWTTICNTNNSDTVMCSLWASYAATAVKENLKVTVHYNVSDGSSCSTLPTYGSAPKPSYLLIHNPAS